MPVRIDGNRQKGWISDPPERLDYKYPRNLDLFPKSEFHKELLGKIMDRVMLSHSQMNGKYDTWNKLDQNLTSYIPLNQEEQEAEDKDDRKPVSIVIPTSFAALESLRTYMIQAFLNNPVFRYEGVGSEDIVGAMLLERIIQRQFSRNQMAMALNTMFRNAFVYGIGPITPVWNVKEGFKTRPRNVGITGRISDMLAGMSPSGRIKEKQILFEGNQLDIIDPYRYFPDTTVAAWDIKSMEFVGWLVPDNRMNILSEEKLSDGEVFNARYLEYITGQSVYGYDQSKRDKDGITDSQRYDSRKSEVDSIFIYINLIPKDWGLGDEEYPEKWMFRVCGDNIITQAQPMDLDHDEFPVVCAAPDSDGLSAIPVSKMETVHGIQTYMNFLINSRIANVRKSLAGSYVFNPQKVNTNDLKNRGPGKLIRLRERAWNSSVRDSIEQLGVDDITAGNPAEMVQINQLLERATGAVDFQQGILRGGERRTAREIDTVSGGALGRLETNAILMGAQAMQPLGYMLASQTQQFMTIEQFVQSTGRYEQELREIFREDGGDENRILVDPSSILIDYDVDVRDGSLPDKGDPNIWLQIYQATIQNPEATRDIDTVRILMYIAKLMGADNIESFVRQSRGVDVTVQDDDTVARELERGNLRPTGEA